MDYYLDFNCLLVYQYDLNNTCYYFIIHLDNLLLFKINL